MRLILKSDTLLVESIFETPSHGIIIPEGSVTTQIALVRQTTYEAVSVGDRILHPARAGLGIRSNGNRFILLDAGDVLAKLE